MAKHYPLNLIRKNYSYSTQQVADLYGLNIASVQRWIRNEGLKAIKGSRLILVHSSELKSFLAKKQHERKQPCQPNEIYCMKCQAPRHPIQGSVKTTACSNGSKKVKAKCNTCRAQMNRNIKAREWSKKHPLAQYIGGAPKPLNGVEALPRECTLQGELKL